MNWANGRAGLYSVVRTMEGWVAYHGGLRLGVSNTSDGAKAICQSDYDYWLAFHSEVNRRFSDDRRAQGGTLPQG